MHPTLISIVSRDDWGKRLRRLRRLQRVLGTLACLATWVASAVWLHNLLAADFTIEHPVVAFFLFLVLPTLLAVLAFRFTYRLLAGSWVKTINTGFAKRGYDVSQPFPKSPTCVSPPAP